jgi:hypothetical protein
MQLSDIYIYRMTHIENIPHILRFGITHQKSPNANSNYKAIGDSNLISQRADTIVSITNGCIDQDCGTIRLGDMIPFYFCCRTPMLYVIQKGGYSGTQITLPKDIVYIACSINSFIRSDITFFFSNGHARDNTSMFYDRMHVDCLPSSLNWEAMHAKYWNGEENRLIKTQKQAEFLVGEDIPIQYIYGLICYDDRSKQQLVNYGVASSMHIRVGKEYYF